MTEVVWITRTYPWREQPTFGFFYQTQARALARLGLQITVACPTPMAPWPLPRLRDRWRIYAEAPAWAVDEGVTVIRPRYPNVPGEPSWARPDSLVSRSMWRARDEWAGAKVIHGHYSVTGLAAWRLARRTGIPYVLTFHGSDMNSWPDEHPERLDDLRQAVSGASAVIAVSQALADRVYSVTGVAATPLPLGSDHRSMARSAIGRREARTELGVGDDDILVLFVGNLNVQKGVRELIDALVQLGPPFRGVLIGAGPLAGYGMDTVGSDAVIDYRGARDHDAVIRAMSGADVFVLPSYTEGMPTVLVEAGSMRLPVIASRVGGIPELLGEDRGVLLPEVSPEYLKAALLAFVADRDAARASADRLHDVVLDRYDVDRNASRLLDLYRSVAPGLAVGDPA